MLLSKIIYLCFVGGLRQPLRINGKNLSSFFQPSWFPGRFFIYHQSNLWNMAKRLTDTEKWNDDWYLSLDNDYRIIWQWLLDNCNHAGICKRNIKLLNVMCNTNISEPELIEKMVDRVVAEGNDWFIPKFLKFQYADLQSNRPVIISVR